MRTTILVKQLHDRLLMQGIQLLDSGVVSNPQTCNNDCFSLDTKDKLKYSLVCRVKVLYQIKLCNSSRLFYSFQTLILKIFINKSNLWYCGVVGNHHVLRGIHH